MKTLIQYLAVGGAGFLGAISRLAVATFFGRWFDTRFPLGTLVINVSGSFFLGWFLTLISDRYPVSDTVRMAVAVGFVGAYTTFSTFTYESTKLFDDGAAAIAMGNICLSLALGLLAVRFGAILARHG
jgi:CrcB protein